MLMFWQEIRGLEQQLETAHKMLAAVKQDLSQDECIFADKQREISDLRQQVAELQQAYRQQQEQVRAQMRALQQESNR
jgi:septal ring factor EnvC (AmiA/AmiB activator)